MYKHGSMDRLGIQPLGIPYPVDDGCMNRIPYASVIAFVMCFTGIIMFSIMMVFSFNASVEQARRIFEITNIPWLDKVHLLFIIVAVVMVGMALYLLCVAILSTGSTRENVYRRPHAIRGGRVCCIAAIILAYLVNIMWILVLAITAILCAMYFTFSRLCSSLPVFTENTCLDFSVFRPLVDDFSKASLVLCGGNLQQFCALTNTVVTWYFVGFIGSFIICLGLIQFMASNAANFSHVNNEERYNELRDIVFSENYPEYSPSPNIYAPPAKYPLGTPQINGTLSTYNYGTHPRNMPPPAPQMPINQGSLLRQQGNGAPPYAHSRRNSYHNSFHETGGWPNSQY